MFKTGLIAFAQTYDFAQSEIARLKILARRFLEEFREQIARSIGVSIRIHPIDDAATGESTLRGQDHSQELSYQVLVGLDGEFAMRLQLDSSMAIAIAEGALGCATDPAQANIPTRSLTATEERIVTTTAAEAATAAAEIAFRDVLDANSPMPVMSAGRSDCIAPSIAATRPMLEVAARCEAGGRSGTIAMGVPAAVLRSPKRTSRDSSRTDPFGEMDYARRHLGRCELIFSAVLGRREMLFSEIRSLAPGSLVSLSSLRTSIPRIQLCCNGKALFDGAIVTHRGWNLVVPNDVLAAVGSSTQSKIEIEPTATPSN